jgi:ankyrin repeat protein
MLLNNGAAMNLRDRQQSTALSQAVCHGYDDMAETLIAHGADCNIPKKK